MDMLSELPKEILQRILCLLSQEEAVRTSVLSKPWRYIWRTRPNLVFSDNDNYFRGKEQEFLSVVDETLRGYLDQGLRLEEFHLHMSNHVSVSLLDKWIPKLVSMGVNDFRLYVLSKHEVDGMVDLPVVLKAEPLTLLWLYNCDLGRNIPENIPFVRLEVLRLHNVSIEQEIFDKVISSCALLASMWFQDCKGLTTIKLETKLHKHLKQFIFINDVTYQKDDCSIEINAPTLEKVKIFGSKIRFHGRELSNIKSLYLANVEIAINSVERSPVLCIDAPKMESNLKLYMRDDGANDAQSWFLRLSALLRDLRRSEITLHIFHLARFGLQIEEDILVRDNINGGNYNPVVVENFRLEIGQLSLFPYVLSGLFCICRPRKISPQWLGKGTWTDERKQKEAGEFFGKFTKMIENGNREIWRDLEGLTFEGLDEIRLEWQPFEVMKLLETEFTEFRIRMKWSDRD
ncbi:hypothetical protein MIMGU_mgv1a006063mg [Erythranthe guttata]|uniref:F-box domain-containing protein n=1 Tax=Erythranthe guttata TaxID=4155 RepID=A0A022QRF3_ERYGU|nr:hypothetical protein MIMGU_mgv1a006063mg [Erythranthe guttata]